MSYKGRNSVSTLVSGVSMCFTVLICVLRFLANATFRIEGCNGLLQMELSVIAG